MASLKAALIVVAVADPKRSEERNGTHYHSEDVGIALQLLVLAAKDRGLAGRLVKGLAGSKVRTLMDEMAQYGKWRR